MADDKVNATEILLCAVVVLLAGLSVSSFAYARYMFTHGGGSGFGPGVEIGISIIAGFILSGIGSFVSFFVQQQETLSLKRTWYIASRLNYLMFLAGGIFLLFNFF